MVLKPHWRHQFVALIRVFVVYHAEVFLLCNWSSVCINDCFAFHIALVKSVLTLLLEVFTQQCLTLKWIQLHAPNYFWYLKCFEASIAELFNLPDEAFDHTLLYFRTSSEDPRELKMEASSCRVRGVMLKQVLVLILIRLHHSSFSLSCLCRHLFALEWHYASLDVPFVFGRLLIALHVSWLWQNLVSLHNRRPI